MIVLNCTVDNFDVISFASRFDKDGDLEVDLPSGDTGCMYLSRNSVEALRDHLTAVLAESSQEAS